MSILDTIFVVLLLFGLIRGFIKGLFVEIASLLALILGVYGAIHFSYFTADYLSSQVNWNIQTINIIAFAITFVSVVLLISLAGRILTKLADFMFLGIINKILGGVFGLFKISLILSVVIILLGKFNLPIPFLSASETNQSIFYYPVKSIAPTIFPDIIKADAAVYFP